MPGKRHPPETKELASTLLASFPQQSVATLLGVPLSTIHHWLNQIRAMGDSEREASMADKRKVSDLLWAYLEEGALLRALLLALHEGSAKEMQAAATTAGISRDKIKDCGQPRNITPPSSTSHSTLIQDALGSSSTPSDTKQDKPGNESE